MDRHRVSQKTGNKDRLKLDFQCWDHVELRLVEFKMKIISQSLVNKEFCHKLKYSNPCYTFLQPDSVNLLKFQTETFWSQRIHTFKPSKVYTIGLKSRKSEFVAKFLVLNMYNLLLLNFVFNVKLLISLLQSYLQLELCPWTYIKNSLLGNMRV